MDEVDAHLVHPFELGQGGIDEGQGGLGALPPGVGGSRLGPLAVGRHRFEALPVGEGAESGVAGQQGVEMGGAGAGEAADDDGPGHLHLQDLGVATDEVLQQQAVPQQATDEQGLGQPAGAVQPSLGAEGGTEHVQPIEGVRRAEVVQPGLGHRLGHQPLGVEGHRGPGIGHGDQDGGHVVAEPRLGQVVQDDRRGTSAGGHATDATGTTTVSGWSGVVSGRNQRSQIHPRRCPAVDTQFRWPGSVGEITISHEPSGS